MPRLVDLLTYLAQPGLEDIWLLLDVKVRKALRELLFRDVFFQGLLEYPFLIALPGADRQRRGRDSQ